MIQEDTCELYFSNLECKIKNKDTPILNKLSGHFPSSSLIAVLGPSGSGKSTLLNILSGYNGQNTTFDALQINGVETNVAHLANISCYLTQDIHLNDLLSVEENMRFAADFKLGLTHSQDEKTAIITEILDSFGLSSSRKTRAGKLSGGERKRLALSLEMISNPRIIYLDEPTSGLDISATHQILQYLKKIATSGKTVICTIHQVCASHFELFDWAYVIADGQCAYQGRSQDLVLFMEDIGLPCDIYHNPADYLIELCAGDYGGDKVDQLVNASQNGRTYTDQYLQETKSESNVTVAKLTYGNATWKYQWETLLRRDAIKTSRNRLLIPMRIVSSNLISFFIGLLFWDMGNDASKTLFNYQFCLTVSINVFMIGIIYPVVTFPNEIELIKRELYNRYYTLLQYNIIMFLLDLPVLVIGTATSSLLAWYMSGQPMDIERILVYLLFLITYACVINAIGFFFGTFNISITAGVVCAAMTQVPIMGISGYALHFIHMHPPLERLGRLFYMRNCIQGSLVAVFGLSNRKIPCPDAEEFCYFKEPHKFLEFIGIDSQHYAYCYYNLIAWLLIFKIATYFTMKHRLCI